VVPVFALASRVPRAAIVGDGGAGGHQEPDPRRPRRVRGVGPHRGSYTRPARNVGGARAERLRQKFHDTPGSL